MSEQLVTSSGCGRRTTCLADSILKVRRLAAVPCTGNVCSYPKIRAVIGEWSGKEKYSGGNSKGLPSSVDDDGYRLAIECDIGDVLGILVIAKGNSAISCR